MQMVALKELNEPLVYFPGDPDCQEKLKKLPFSEAAIQTLLVHKNIVRTLWADVSIVDPDTGRPLGIKFHDVVGTSVRVLSPVLPFQPKYRLRHPGNYSFLLSENMFIGSKYSKIN